jgi:hypothetical protein
MAFQVGPVLLEPDRWPASWLATAAASFPTVPSVGTSQPSAITVTYSPEGLRDDERGIAPRAEELIQQSRRGTIWRVLSPGMFAAELDLHARHYIVRSGDPDIEPELALKNPLRALLATLMPLEHNGLMIHACAGILNDAGVLVAGVSTAGKTTLALGFRDTTYLTDDVTLVGRLSSTAPQPQLLASPFFGGAGVRGVDATAPLRAIGILVGKELDPQKRSSFERVRSAQGCAALLRHVARFTKDRELSGLLIDQAAHLVEHVPVVLIRRSLLDTSDLVVAQVLELAQN